MLRLDAGTVLLQWATGGLLFLWVTTRRRQVGVGYGWLLRASYLIIAVGAAVAGRLFHPFLPRDAAAAATALAAGVALVLSVVRRKAGVRGERARARQRAARVSAMTGSQAPTSLPPSTRGPGEAPSGEDVAEFPPALDLLAPALGALGLVAASADAGSQVVLALGRTLAGAGFLGAITDAMLLGHWYLVQPGLGRGPLVELNRWVMLLWPFEVGALLWPTGMVSVLTGAIDDGWNGLLGWFWAASAVTTLVLSVVTSAVLRERAYSAVMAATGLLYLAILTAFGTDLVARALLAP